MKKFINKILNVPKLILTLWIILWVVLILLLIMKFCFNQWYPIIVNNEAFINVCDYIDSVYFLKIMIALVFYMANFNISFLTFTAYKRYSKWYYLIILNIICVGVFFAKNFNNLLGLILEISLFVILAIILNLKRNRFRNKLVDVLVPIVAYAILNLFQLTIYFVRGLNLNELTSYPVLIPYILQLDYYIFLIITWMGVSFMGIYGLGWLWTKDVTVLKAIKEKELAKAKPDTKLIEKIDERIAKLEEGK